MIVRVWGIVNSTEVEFTPIKNREGYWEGFAPKDDGKQDIEIWAENDQGARGHLKCTASIEYDVETRIRILLLPYYAELVESIRAEYHGCRKVAEY